jgi:acyl-CoA synthetase (AMP-forming)/AMP-acid ligase II
MHPRFHAERQPDKTAAIMSDTGEALTYGELEATANRGAQFFRSVGLANGDTVAFWLPNTLRVFEFYWAAQRAGLIIVPISSQLTAEEAAYILADSGARLLLTSGSLQASAALFESAAWKLPELRDLLWTDVKLGGAASWRAAIAAHPAAPIGDEQAGWHMVYSSGTTGRPKGVRLPLSGGPATAENILAVRQRDMYGCDANTVYLCPAPLYHTAPLVFTTSSHRLGSTVIVMPKFDAEAALVTIARYRVDFVQMVPTMFIRMLQLPEATRLRHDISSLRVVVHAAAPCPVDVKQRMISWLGPIIYEYYGASEGNGSTFITSEEWLRKPGSVGRAVLGNLHICAQDGTELAPGEQGLVYFEGGWDFAYLNDEKKTKESRNKRHPSWSTVGDIGYMDSDGYLFLTDRQSFMIISGGVNIYPQEAESLLCTHPRVADAAVIGVPHPEMGEEVRAVVQPLDWDDATPALAAELIAWCRQHLSPVKCPRAVDFDPALPRHDTGKLYKRLIRDRYWEGHAKRIA